MTKISKEVVGRQLNVLSVAGQGTSEMLPKSQTSTHVSLDGKQTRVSKGSRLTAKKTCIPVPVMGQDRKLRMPTISSRARKWIESGKATPYWCHGIFCVRMNVETGKELQPIACGIDPGSKKEGYTVKSKAHTYLNVNADAVTWVKDSVEVRRMMRKHRRFKKTPYRACRSNRTRGDLAPSTKTRWQWKLRIASWLLKMFPITCFIVEDIKAKTKGKPRWDKSFSPLETGKNWFYTELAKLGQVELKQGWETKHLRDQLGLKKTHNKMENVFSAHCVDSWVLANWYTGGHTVPDNEDLLLITPLQFHRRQLHVLQPTKNGIRKPYGGTVSLGFRRGSIVSHPKYGITYVGGNSNGRITLHSLETGERLSRKINPRDLTFKSYNSWRTQFLPSKKREA